MGINDNIGGSRKPTISCNRNYEFLLELTTNQNFGYFAYIIN